MSWDFFNRKIVKAAKAHRCEQCYGEIAQGERHSYGAGKWDGDFWSYREHADCREAWLKHVVEHLEYYDEAPFLRDLNSDERDGVISEFPQVAARLGWFDVNSAHKNSEEV